MFSPDEKSNIALQAVNETLPATEAQQVMAEALTSTMQHAVVTLVNECQKHSRRLTSVKSSLLFNTHTGELEASCEITLD